MRDKKTQTDYAKEFGVSDRTIRTWQTQGAPFDDVALMESWLSTRKQVPEGARKWLEKRAGEKMKKRADMADRRAAALPQAEASAEGAEGGGSEAEAQGLGAEHALKRIAEEERASYRSMERARRAGNLLEFAKYHDIWVKTVTGLRQMDGQVDINRRDAGQMVPIDDMKQILQNVGYFFRAAVRTAAKATAVELFERQRHEIAAILSAAHWSSFMSAVAALRGDSKGNHCPDWAFDALIQSLKQSCNGVDGAVQVRAETLSAVLVCIENGWDLNRALRSDWDKTDLQDDYSI